jgi:hypothetical protein
MFGTTRIDFDPHDPRDIIIVASPGTNIEAVIREPIECSGINPASIVRFETAQDTAFEPVWEQEIHAMAKSVLETERRMALYSDEGPNERYLRDLMGDDAYENWEIQD